MKTTGPMSTKFGTKHPWVDGIKFFTNKGPHPSSNGDNTKIIKIYENYTSLCNQYGTPIKHPWVEDIQICF